MSATDTVARMLALVPWLLERPGASVSEAAETFGVDRATILRDLDTIGYCGLPGLGGGDLFAIDVIQDRIVVELTWVEQPLRLNPREALRLVIAGEAVLAALGEELPALRSAVAAVRRAAGVPPAVRVELTDDGTRWLPSLRAAIGERRRVTLVYRARDEEEPSERALDPWRLHVAEGAWYVQGLDGRSGEVRTFRLDRIADLTVTDEQGTDPPADVDLEPPRYEPGPEDVEVELVLAPGSRWVADAVRLESTEDLPDGRRRIVFRTDVLRWVTRLVLGAGPGVEVVRPDELARAVREQAQRALARYSDAAPGPRRDASDPSGASTGEA